MTQLAWDSPGDRFFETGIDRGVLFPPDGSAVAWNGLIGINEETTREVKAYWLDGVKYLDHHVPGSYAAKLDAFTYPDVLEELLGTAQYAPGVFLHDQRAKIFHLSYRTGVGNDLDPELGYKLHIIYNVMAVAEAAQIGTRSNAVEAGAFSWALTGTPPVMFGARPTAHIHLDSRRIDPSLLVTIETMLYGSADVDPALLALTDLLTIVEGG